MGEKSAMIYFENLKKKRTNVKTYDESERREREERKGKVFGMKLYPSCMSESMSTEEMSPTDAHTELHTDSSFSFGNDK